MGIHCYRAHDTVSSGRARAKGPMKMPQAALGLSSALTWPTRTVFDSFDSFDL